MFFDDEKDIISEGADIHIDEDGTVTWEDVMDQDADEPAGKNIDANGNGIPDELELVQNIEEEEVNDQDLVDILNDVRTETHAETSHQSSKSTLTQEEDFDIDSQLTNVVLEQNKTDGDDDFIPRKTTTNSKSSSSTPLLIIILLGVLIAGGAYYGKTYFEENDTFKQVSQVSHSNNLEPAPSVQQEMNNITQEELAQRQQQNIPVVNEEQAQELQAAEEAAAKAEEEAKKAEEEKLKNEKKQVVAVIPTGRPNPFMPTDKYIKTSIPEAEIQYGKSGVPAPPDDYGQKDGEEAKLMSIAVSGIMYDDVKPSAIITYDNNDYFVQKGDKLDNYRIVEIAKSYVRVALGNNVYKANIGEEFKITTNFYGRAQYDKAGARHYHTITDEQTYGQAAIEKNNGLRYVSEDDIRIKTR